jgi:hypothetical protein
VLGAQGLLPHEARLVEADQAAETHLVRRVPLAVDHRLFRAEEVDVDEQQARPRRAPRRAPACPAGLMSKGAPGLHQRVPDVDGACRGHPDLVAEIAGVPGARDLDAHAADHAARHAEVPQPIDVGVAHRAQHAGRGRPLQRERGHLLGDVVDLPPQPGAFCVSQRRLGSAAVQRNLVSPRPSPSHRLSPCRLRRTTGCSRPARRLSFFASRVMMRSTRRTASGPETRYL